MVTVTCDLQHWEDWPEGARPIGSNHTYNGTQLHEHVIDMKSSGSRVMDYDAATGQCLVGSAVTVEQLKTHLATHGRILWNSGNYMKQTVIGAMLNGTHGYGAQATMAEMIVSVLFRDGTTSDNPEFFVRPNDSAPIDLVLINTMPLQQHIVDLWMTRFSSIEGDVHPHWNRAYAVFPYSHPTDWMTAVTLSSATIVDHTPTKAPWTLPWSEWAIKYYWAIDSLFPKLRHRVQRAMCAIPPNIKTIVTSKDDVDWRYDPYPAVESSRSPSFLKKFMQPTHFGYNIALFVEKPSEVIPFIIREGNKLHPDLFRTFIGVRELNTACNIPYAGNFEKPRVAIDLYFDPKLASYGIALQNMVESEYETRSHWGKTVR